jgi:type IX secretion system PorP/SprF family membrane protein
MKQQLLCTIGFICIHFCTQAQDVHFSIAASNPMVLNPALAGANCNKEATLNYRSQWGSLGEPYKTTTAGYSARIPNKKRNASNSFALGVQLINDKAGDPSIVSNNFSVVLADHLRVGTNSTLGFGMMLGLGQRSIRQATGQWASQYNGTAYDPSLSSGESLDNIDFRFADAGVGMVYAYGRRGGTLARNEDRTFNVGVSVYHVNRPNYSFFKEQEDRLPMRLSVFANAEFALEAMDAAVLPGIYFHNQGNATEILLGSSYKFKLMNDTRYTGFNKALALSVGFFGRIGDAAILKMMLDWDHYSFGYAFDINTSRLNTYTNGNGSHEIFLRYSSPFSRPTRGSRY